ncbi:MAG: hypothetical protein AAF728_09965, partial [Cyanobacteria bacterium P01_D01_bin.128]
DIKTGRLLWQDSINGQYFCSHFAVSGKILIGKMSDFKIHAIDLDTGSQMWSLDIGKPINAYSPPIISGNTFCISCGGYFLGIDIFSGRKIFVWEIPLRFEKLSGLEYSISQILNVVGKFRRGAPGLASISSPCVTH